MKSRFLALAGLLALSALFLASCGGGGGGGSSTVSLSGLVTDAVLATAIEGASIVVGGVAGAPTDATGAYSVANITLGSSRTVYLSVAKTGYRSLDLAVTFPSGTSALVQDVSLVPVSSGVTAGQVSGAVTVAGSGAPVGQASVAIEVLGLGGDVVDVLYAHTASDGAFFISGVPTGNARARVIATGYLEETELFTVLADDATPPLALQLTPGTTTVAVNGLVRNSETLLPVSGASISLGGQSATSQGDGSFTVPDVQVGDQTLTVTATGYDPYLALVRVTTDMEPVIAGLISAGEEPPGGPYSIIGNALLSGQIDHSGIKVSLLSVPGGVELDSMITGTNGFFGFWQPTGTYLIRAEKTGYITEEAQVIVPPTGDPVTGVELVLGST